jgi:hypothetical protein
VTGTQPVRRVTILDCPLCGLPAEIVARFTFDGSPGPVEHVKVLCVGGHWFTLPVDSLRLPVMTGRSPSLVGRVMTYLREFWREYDYAGRRMLEAQLGVPMR